MATTWARTVCRRGKVTLGQGCHAFRHRLRARRSTLPCAQSPGSPLNQAANAQPWHCQPGTCLALAAAQGWWLPRLLCRRGQNRGGGTRRGNGGVSICQTHSSQLLLAFPGEQSRHCSACPGPPVPLSHNQVLTHTHTHP